MGTSVGRRKDVVGVIFACTRMTNGMRCFGLCRWEELVTLVNQRDALLKAAEEVHKFITDASETNDRMNEKVRSCEV